ncbi:DUF692 domain-containing protein [Pendulispora albinea]|uniref:UPF0276 protein LZC94_43660 n=1 Tax=Pendulispora albinea TaxID=2741071 RepID=A0ABZ2LUV7_9BACT
MSFRDRHSIGDLGVGVGARAKHYPQILGPDDPKVDWFEIISDNFLVGGGAPQRNLERLLARYRVIPHGVSLSIGASHPLDRDYLGHLKALVARIRPPWASDHLCWSDVPGANLHDLLPLPYTRAALAHVVSRVREVQDFLEVPFALENVSSYMTYRASTMPEWEFLAEVAERADCGILLDCNNVYVSSFNHGFDPNVYIDAIPAHRVVQIHLAGYTDRGAYLLDTHSRPVADAVWQLYRRAIRRIGPTSTLIEWDSDLPDFDVLVAEASRARRIRDDVSASERALTKVAS